MTISLTLKLIGVRRGRVDVLSFSGDAERKRQKVFHTLVIKWDLITLGFQCVLLT